MNWLFGIFTFNTQSSLLAKKTSAPPVVSSPVWYLGALVLQIFEQQAETPTRD